MSGTTSSSGAENPPSPPQSPCYTDRSLPCDGSRGSVTLRSASASGSGRCACRAGSKREVIACLSTPAKGAVRLSPNQMCRPREGHVWAFPPTADRTRTPNSINPLSAHWSTGCAYSSSAARLSRRRTVFGPWRESSWIALMACPPSWSSPRSRAPPITCSNVHSSRHGTIPRGSMCTAGSPRNIDARSTVS